MAKKRKPLPPAGAAPRERRMADPDGPARPRSARPPVTTEERQRWRRLGFIAIALVPVLIVMAVTTGGGTATFVLIAFVLGMIWIALVAFRRARE